MKYLLFALALTVSQLSFSQESGIPTPVDDPHVLDKHQQHQENRINQGVASGAINKKEERQLKMEQARIKRMEKRAKKDGTVSKREKKHINHAQNHASHHIAKKKKNKK